MPQSQHDQADSSLAAARYVIERGDKATRSERSFLNRWATKPRSNEEKSAGAGGNNVNANVNGDDNNNKKNINDGGDGDDSSVLSSRIMRSGLTHVGQILRADPGSLSEDDRRLLYATMSDSRYQKAWKSSPRRQKPRSQLLRPQRQPQLHQDQDQDEAYDQHQQGEFASVEEVTEELLKVVEQQKQHLLAAVECEVRIKELWWYRHAMEEKGKEKEKEKEGGD